MCRTVIKDAGLKEGEEWIEKFDVNAFAADIHALGKKLESEQGPDDVAHLDKMIMWSNVMGALGLLTMGFSVNIFSIAMLSTFTFTRWTMIAHHTCHGGYDKCNPNKRFSRFRFAIGSLWRRMRDWMDWMLPEAWNVEHNNRHHYNLSEIHDPDLVEANSAMIRGLDVPVAVKYVMVAFLMMTWKWYYYAPNTYKELKLAKLRREGKPLPKGVKPEAQVTFDSILLGLNPFYTMSEFFTVVIGPYFLVHFIITPLPLLVLEHYLGVEGLYRNALINMAFADVLTNIHSFVAIVTNHAGNDMYRFRDGCRPFSGSFYLRQVLASVDFSMGTDVIDLLHGWLNYQIEHHLWPNLSMLSYQKSAPAVRALCAKHGVPYIKENVFIRVKKTVDIMVGNTSMKWFPEKYEKAFLEKDAVVEASKLKGQ